jgi:hypothetical protein
VPYDVVDLVDEGAVVDEPLLAMLDDLFVIFRHIFEVVEELVDDFHFAYVNFGFLPRKILLVDFHGEFVEAFKLFLD